MARPMPFLLERVAMRIESGTPLLLPGAGKDRIGDLRQVFRHMTKMPLLKNAAGTINIFKSLMLHPRVFQNPRRPLQ